MHTVYLNMLVIEIALGIVLGVILLANLEGIISFARTMGSLALKAALTVAALVIFYTVLGDLLMMPSVEDAIGLTLALALIGFVTIWPNLYLYNLLRKICAAPSIRAWAQTADFDSDYITTPIFKIIIVGLACFAVAVTDALLVFALIHRLLA